MAKRKPIGMFDVEQEDGAFKKLPTLRQFLKELPKDADNPISTVRVIWLPGQWDNFTLQTDLFRVSVARGTELYSALSRGYDEFTKGTQTFDVAVTNRAKISYRLVPNTEITGEWFFIGSDSGIKFESDSDGSDEF